MTKSLGVGLLSRNALLALQLSRRGFTAAPDAFEHHHGYFNVFNNGEANYDISRALEPWHEPWAIVDKGVNKKRFPCCYACLAPIDGLLEILEARHLDHRQVRKITCEVHPARYPHINVPDPDTALAAKFSVHYCLALAAVKGRLEIADFEGEMTHDGEVKRLMHSVEFGRYENNDNITGSRVILTTVDGATHEVFIERPYGSALKPLPPQGLREKFLDCSRRALSPGAAEELYDVLVRLEEIEDFREVIRKSRTGA
jgi:2-methylcitrate dehydratase PrpD